MSDECWDNVIQDSVVHLNYAGITDTNINRLNFHGTEYLFLKRNTITKLPSSITILRTLKVLHLEGNNLDVLPIEIGQLSSLCVLNLVGNQLTTLPETIGCLASLTKLQLSNNAITNLPKEIGNLKKLQTLESYRNELTQVPVELANCEQLQLLALDKNKLRCFPRQLCHIGNLKELSLAGNQLEYIPPLIFKKLTYLKELILDNNPALKSLPADYRQSPCNVHCSGCFQKYIETCDVFSHVVVASWKIAVPTEIGQICVPGADCVPSLVEFSLRAVKNALHYPSGVSTLSIPTDLKDNLRFPTAVCTHCNSSLFRAVFLLVFKSSFNSLFCTDYYCSVKCLQQICLPSDQVYFPAGFRLK